MARAASRIRLLDGTNPGGSEPGNNRFSLLANRGFHESADDVVVRDLTLDGNFDRQNRWSTIVENRFLDVETGLAFQITGTAGVPFQFPLHEDLLVERNTVRTGQPQRTEWGTDGVQLYGQAVGTDIRFKNVTIRDNVLSGRAFPDPKAGWVHPRGLVFQVLGANYERIRLLDNVVDVPDHEPGGVVPDLAGSLSLTFFPMARWSDDLKTGRVLYRGNRDPAGKPLDPILADWSHRNRPHWGRPQGPVPVPPR